MGSICLPQHWILSSLLKSLLWVSCCIFAVAASKCLQNVGEIKYSFWDSVLKSFLTHSMSSRLSGRTDLSWRWSTCYFLKTSNDWLSSKSDKLSLVSKLKKLKRHKSPATRKNILTVSFSRCSKIRKTQTMFYKATFNQAKHSLASQINSAEAYSFKTGIRITLQQYNSRICNS